MLIGAGVVIVRRVFVVFGAVGCAHLPRAPPYEVFEDSWLFPIALTAIGLGFICLGFLWQKNEKKITRKVRRYLPLPLRELLEERAK